MCKASCVLLFFLFSSSVLSSAQQGDNKATNAQEGAPVTSRTTPTSTQRPIFLDVLVADRSGKPVADLEPFDFSVLDNNQPRKILGFRRTDGAAGSKMDPPVEVIIVLDAVNLPYQATTRLRLEVDKFLRENDGHLKQPVSIFVFASDGLHVQPASSKDGNALAKMLDESNGTVRSRDLSGGVYSLQEQFQSSIEAMTGIAENMSHKPGRKLVIWLGPGWPLLTERFFIQTDVSRATYFRKIVALSAKLREARITLYSLFTVVGATNTLYQGYLKPVREVKKTEIANLALQVLATETGGQVIDPSNDVRGQIDRCVSDVGEYYTLAIAPPVAAAADEYHDLKVLVDKPELTVRTNTGYYNEPPSH